MDGVRSARRQTRRATDGTGVATVTRTRRARTAIAKPEIPLVAPAPSLVMRVMALMTVLRGWLANINVRRATHRLRVDEFASLGEKRFVAVVHFENERFLIGGAGSSVSLLAKLSRGTTNFASTISACLEQGK